jgi:hypothetical protein
MSTIKLPGFTAEMSLYKMSARSRGAVDQAFQTGDQAVIPQILWGLGSVMAAIDCEFVCQPDRYGAGTNCFWHCGRFIPAVIPHLEGML